MNVLRSVLLLFFAVLFVLPRPVAAEPLEAGTAKVDITSPSATRVHDPAYAKVLVLRQGEVTAALITVDAVAIGGIGAIRDTFMESVRKELATDPGIPPENVIVNASHCHAVVRGDCEPLVVNAVREAWKHLTPVRVGAGSATENRISENRRVILKDGRQVDMRRAYAFAWDEDIASVGPIDPQVGLLRLDRYDGRPLAIVYNFACHPIMNPPSKGSSADYPGFASRLIESALGPDTMAFFIQGCGGDINPVRYKEVSLVADSEPLGDFLGATILKGRQTIATVADAPLVVHHQMVSIPRATDYERRIEAIEAERLRLMNALRGTNVNFKTFLPLLIQQGLHPEFPSASAQGYRHDQKIGRDDLPRHDAENRAQVETYLANIKIMEELTRLNTNLALLKMHQAKAAAAPTPILRVEMCALRVGDFKLVTFPGELTVEIGLNIKKAIGDPHAVVAGYTNGYIYYTPTAEQRLNTGYAQEDCDCMVAPQWQEIFETKALEMLRGL